MNIYAHRKENKEKELLSEHQDLCLDYFKRIDKEKGILDKVEKCVLKYLERNITKDEMQIFKDAFVDAIWHHDEGKRNPLFQKKKMKNNNLMREKELDKISEDIGEGSKHSLISALIYIKKYFYKIKEFNFKDEELEKDFKLFIFVNAYIISKHHGNLDEFYKFIGVDGKFGRLKDITNAIKENYETLKSILEDSLSEEEILNRLNYKKDMYNTIDRVEKKDNKESSIAIYIYAKLLYSSLVSCDYYSTSQYMSDSKMNSFGSTEDPAGYDKIFEETELTKIIRKYEKDSYGKRDDFSDEKNINVMRSEMFLDAERKYIENKDKRVYLLEAPTGSGKSNAAVNLSLKMMKEGFKKLYYVYPFNNLVEQNRESLDKIFRNTVLENDIAVVNSLEEIVVNETKDEDICNKYQRALLDRQFLNYPFILTTHVSLFDTLFGDTAASCFGFIQLIDSVIVFDEIQSYKSTIWEEIIQFLYTFSEILNMKIIIMSATLPDLTKLIGEKGYSVELIDDREKYFPHKLFKNRVEVSYELLNEEIEKDDIDKVLFEHISDNLKKYDKIMIEFIKKQSAMDFYNMFIEENEIDGLKIALMTGDDNIHERKKIINEVKAESGKILLIATQVVEAGVDIDMDIGYKDTSKIDSEEQFMGRINRSAKKDNSIVYFFNKDKADDIYRNDIAVKNNLTIEKNEDMRKALMNKEFSIYYDKIMEFLMKKNQNYYKGTELFYKEKVGKLNFNEIKKRMKLIDDSRNRQRIFLNRTISDDNGNMLFGKDVWNDYKKLLLGYEYYNEEGEKVSKELDYAQWKVELSRINKKMNYFIYEINDVNGNEYNDSIGDILYFEDGEYYIKNDKLDREKFYKEQLFY
ncbi:MULTISPECIES: CRISPR-associated helicase Cas3' [Peptostreptococcales]|uniref:CRISPR-associated helicase Cas3' n=1 Tax=Peptostreptococcales TaxID=3082720 RepID=UPI000E52D2FC|nr:CRISPR-associated helicase Cas3' [Peptoclostridium sp. AF21-18]RHQ95370.1 CRISPR-associated helicase Cas3' [Peptoclostridium sp. AF21-18]